MATDTAASSGTNSAPQSNPTRANGTKPAASSGSSGAASPSTGKPRAAKVAASVGSGLASATEAKRFVLVGVGGTALLAAIGTYRAGKTPTPRIAVGAVSAGVILAVLAEVLPDLAGALALLMLTTAAFVTLRGGWEGIAAATQIGA
jgi:hypothetical protein